MTAPISFIMPAYNCRATIAESVLSIINGNISDDDEIVIVNDGSTDDTSSVLSELTQKYKSIRVVNHGRNRGGATARNTAVENARHDLIFCLDSDNLLVPGSISKLRNFLSAEKADIATFSELHYFKDNPQQPTHKWRYRSGIISLADALAGAVFPGASGNYLYTRASWLKAGGYPEFAGALDTWGMGIRQLASDQRMAVMGDGHYLHRYGHESYWVRETKKDTTSLKALQILIPFLDALQASSVDYIMSPKGRYVWFNQLDRRPLKLASGAIGSSGTALTMDGKIIPLTNGNIILRAIKKAGRLARR
jgi:glycosyltransferase involved in cell wall biosynthesis